MTLKGLQLSQPLATGKFDSVAKQDFLSDHISLCFDPPITPVFNLMPTHLPVTVVFNMRLRGAR